MDPLLMLSMHLFLVCISLLLILIVAEYTSARTGISNLSFIFPSSVGSKMVLDTFKHKA